jgi:hypothetical protein
MVGFTTNLNQITEVNLAPSLAQRLIHARE